MDIKAYTYKGNGDNLTIVYGMRDGLYFVKVNDDTVAGGWKYLCETRNWRLCFQTLAEVREFVRTMGFVEIV